MNIIDIYNNCAKHFGTLKQFIECHQNAFCYTPSNNEIAYQINGTFNKNNTFYKIANKYDFYLHIKNENGIQQIFIVNHDLYDNKNTFVCYLNEYNIPLSINGKTIKF